MPVNWCTSCKCVLANEEVVNGVCERCGSEVVRKEKSQWMLAITKYAQRLIDDLDDVDYIERVKTQQRNWIGRSTGAEITFKTNVGDDSHRLHHPCRHALRHDVHGHLAGAPAAQAVAAAHRQLGRRGRLSGRGCAQVRF